MPNSFDSTFMLKITYDHSLSDEDRDVLNIRKTTSPAAESPTLIGIIKTLIENKESFEIQVSARYKSSADDPYFYSLSGMIQIRFDPDNTCHIDQSERIYNTHADTKTNHIDYVYTDPSRAFSNISKRINNWLKQIQNGTLHLQ